MSRTSYIMYPEAKRKLESSGLARRIRRADRACRLDFVGYVSDRDVVECAQGMNDEGLFDVIPARERGAFMKSLNDAFNGRDESTSWLVKRKTGESRPEVAAEDFLHLTGYTARNLLRREELFDYKKFGFSSISELTGTVGAAVSSMQNDRAFYDKRAFTWKTTRPDGRVMKSMITGSMHADLRILQRDITVYETTDPLGNRVAYRPETEEDSMPVSAYHSTEPYLLVALLKYVDQLGLKPKALKDNAGKTREWARSLGQGGYTCAEHFGGYDNDPRTFFVMWQTALPQLGSDYKQNESWNPHMLITESGSSYNIAIGPQREFMMVFRHKDAPKDAPTLYKGAASFLPEEVDNVIKGLFIQAAEGLGRTSANQLASILEYRFSPQMQEDQERWARP